MTGKTQLEKKLTGSRLWSIWLWICIVLSALADLNVFISLCMTGESFSYTIFPLILLILDLALAVIAAFSNFRFRHSLLWPIIFAAFTVAITVIFWIWYMVTAGYVIFTNFAFVMWIVVQLLTAAVTVLAAIRASGTGMVMNAIVCVLAIAYTAISVWYIILVGQGGFFGQASGEYNGYSYELRTIGYTYDRNNDYYIADTVLDDSGNTVVIPETFNGKRVGAVSSDLFTGFGVQTLVIESAEPVELLNTEYFYIRNSNFTVYTDRSLTAYYRSIFYTLAETKDTSTASQRFTDIGNVIKPILYDGECSINFTYDYDTLSYANFEALSPVILNEGETFSRSLIKDDYGYMTLSDETVEYDLWYNYWNSDKHILAAFEDENGSAIEGKAITSSVDVAVTFTDIYGIIIDEDNDDVYKLDDTYRSFWTEDGMDSGYRYVTANTCAQRMAELNAVLDAREGFSYAWYLRASGSQYTVFEDLGNIISDGIEIKPMWTMDAPAVPAITKQDGGTVSGGNSGTGSSYTYGYTYGDTLQLKAESSAPYSWMTLTYEWDYSGGYETSMDGIFTITNILPSQSGSYVANAIVSAPGRTSLTATANITVAVSVAKKALDFSWTDPDDMVYSAADKEITCAWNESQVINEDEITYSATNTSVMNAGSYTARVTLTGTCADLYEVTSGTVSHSFTISPYTLEVVWGEQSFTYDGEEHFPEYTVYPLGDDDPGISATGAITDAATGTASLAASNGNYTLSGAQTSFTVYPAPLYLTWSGGDTDETDTGYGTTVTHVYTYNGYDQ